MRKIFMVALAAAVAVVSACGGGGGGDDTVHRSHFKVVQDEDAWGNTSLAEAMAELGYTPGDGAKQYEVLTSAELATTSLDAARDVLVVSSDQNEAFYQTVADNAAKIETFLDKGGVLFLSACVQGDTQTPWLPEGVTRVHLYETENDNVLPDSSLMVGLPADFQGTGASHDYFTDLPAGAEVYVTGRLSGEATLAKFASGNGRVILSGMTLEFGFEFDQDNAALYTRLLRYAMEPSKPVARGEAWRILEVRDEIPWDDWGFMGDSFVAVMADLGYIAGGGTRNHYFLYDSSDFADLELVPGRDVLAIPSRQPNAYYSLLAAEMPRIMEFVENGGVLLLSVADGGSGGGYSLADTGVSLPGGMTLTGETAGFNDIVDAASPLMAGLPDPLKGSDMSHQSLDSLPAGTHVYAQSSDTGDPTLVELAVGSGKVIVSGMTLEFAYYADDEFPESWAGGKMLYPRVFSYAMGDL